MTADVAALILVGFAELLTADGVGIYRDGTPFEDGDTPITLGDLYPDRPAVALTAYDETWVDRFTRRVFVQARVRGSADPLDFGLVGALDASLAWRRDPPMPGGIVIPQVAPVSFAVLGRVAGAYLFSRNYSALV